MKKEANTLLLKLKVVEQFFKLKLKIFSFVVNIYTSCYNLYQMRQILLNLQNSLFVQPITFCKKHERNKTVSTKKTWCCHFLPIQ